MRVARLSQFSLSNAMVGAFGVNTSYQNTCNYSSIWVPTCKVKNVKILLCVFRVPNTRYNPP
jgi:hypothetical protein